MSFPSAWSIKGVDEEAKSLAKRSAAECGVTMGAWLEAAITHITQKSGDEIVDQSKPWPQSVDTRPAVPAENLVSGQKIFNTTIRMGQLVPSPSGPANAAILDEMQKLHQQMRGGFDDIENRLSLIETNLDNVTKSLPSPAEMVESQISAPASRGYALEGISANYQPMSLATSALLIAGPPPSIAVINSVLRWMIVATLGVIAFLVGQHLGVTLF